jgi:Skp family chaperone for outer membrane proteins
MANKSNQEIIIELLAEFKEHRISVMQMIKDLEEIKQNIDRLIPAKLDARYARFFEEKVKSVTELFKTLLEMRKEIQKSLKEEIDLRRKIDISEAEQDIESIIDIRSVAEKVESFQKKQNQFKDDIIKKAQKETDEISGSIVTIQESG